MTVDSAATVDLPHAPVTFIDSPRHPLLRQLHEYWLAKRGKRLTPDAGRVMTMVLETVIGSKSPRFRSGKAFWKPEKSYRDFESCFLPLSADGETVDMILGGMKYDIESSAA